jgi:hypothetical protein
VVVGHRQQSLPVSVNCGRWNAGKRFDTHLRSIGPQERKGPRLGRQMDVSLPSSGS